ncbi:MAG: tripartite tricarboxylate transporter substrate binding protein [Hyphomicrobiales bacterium]|nr:tripartite tricarboxylate transporter substrate binding protein [Hyphomicrobiales bacterium]
MLLAAALRPTLAQEIPKRITLMVGYPAGGSTDIVARVIADKIGPRLNAVVVVENNSGAGGMLAAQAVARATKDGSTLLFAASNEVTILPALKKTMAYDTRTAFAPIALIGMVPLVLAVHPTSRASTVAELVRLAKSQPGKLSYASFGAGTSTHLAGELFKASTGTDIVHVPYKGGAAAMPDLLSGRVEICFHAVPVALPYIRSGALKPLGYTGAQRSPVLPSVPTMVEAGVSDFVVGSWVGVLAPAGVSTELIDALNDTLRAATAMAETQALLQAQGVVPAYKQPKEFTAFIDDEINRWAALGSMANISID